MIYFFCHYPLHLKWFHLNYRNNCEIQIAFYENSRISNWRCYWRDYVCVWVWVYLCVCWIHEITCLLHIWYFSFNDDTCYKWGAGKFVWAFAIDRVVTHSSYIWIYNSIELYTNYLIWMWIASIQRIVWIQLVLYALRMF